MMRVDKKKIRTRNLRAGLRDTFILLREFRGPLVIFFLLIGLAGYVYFWLAKSTNSAIGSWVEAAYYMLSLIFLQSPGEFPDAWYLQIFYFIMPFMGLAIMAQGLTEFGISLFNRRSRSKEWEIAVASTFKDHIVLIGLGHLGFRVAKYLNGLDQEIVIIEKNPNKDLIGTVRNLGIPVIEDDGTNEKALLEAGVPFARTIILCTQNDALNLKMALKARSINPNIDVVIRIFEEDFAEALQKQFGFIALSATGMAAPIFAASASKIDITAPITINGQPNSLAKLTVSAQSEINGDSVGSIEEKYNISVVMLQHLEAIDPHPKFTEVVKAGDYIVVLGVPEQINSIAHDCR